MTIGKRLLLLLLAVPLIALLGFGVFARIQLSRIEERSRFVSESQLAGEMPPAIPFRSVSSRSSSPVSRRRRSGARRLRSSCGVSSEN